VKKITWIETQGFLGTVLIASYRKKPFKYPGEFVLDFHLKIHKDRKLSKVCHSLEEVKSVSETWLNQWLEAACLDPNWIGKQ
jgi:hypothetical protein